MKSTRPCPHMLLIAPDTLRKNQALNDVVREMSFALSVFAKPSTFAELMTGQLRRIVMLTDADVTEHTLQSLKAANGRTPFGVIIAADRASLRTSKQAEVVEKLSTFDNVEWVGKDFNFDRLSSSARRCRRRMLRISRQEVESALVNREFVLRYQPKVERTAGTEWLTREAEALLRWNHPEHGLMGPLEFLPETEAFGLMGKLSEYVLRDASRQLVAWQDTGIHLNSCINLASSQLGDPMLAENYAAIVKQFGLECSRFTFEVVEQDLADPDAPHVQMLRSLRKKGFRICLDDFRVASSSLGTFEKMPFDEIKIHASALRRAQQDRIALTVLAAVTGLAHNLGMSVCAEGVEDRETFEFLKTIECDKMQGFLISEAVIPSIIRRVYSAKDAAPDEEVA
ncbi:MAG: EAL domain-containing protein [Gammaproteobacteria bacterium]|nr:EAL domain-containing protein [Gammaproteobacteria bacterium]